MRSSNILLLLICVCLFSCKKKALIDGSVIRPMGDIFNQKLVDSYIMNSGCSSGEVPTGDYDPTTLGTISVFRERVFNKTSKTWTQDRYQTNVVVQSIIDGRMVPARYTKMSTGEEVYREIPADRDTSIGPFTYEGLGTRPCGEKVAEFERFVTPPNPYAPSILGGLEKHWIASGYVETPVGMFHAYKEVKTRDRRYLTDNYITWQEICHGEGVGLLYDFKDTRDYYREFYLVDFTPGAGEE